MGKVGCQSSRHKMVAGGCEVQMELTSTSCVDGQTNQAKVEGGDGAAITHDGSGSGVRRVKWGGAINQPE